MLLLLIRIASQRYAIPCRDVVEVIPYVDLRKTPNVPAVFAGAIQYRGDIIPVVDLNQLLKSHAIRCRYSTRIVLVTYRRKSSAPKILGLLCEDVTETIVKNPSDLKGKINDEVSFTYVSYLISDAEGTIRLLDIEKILPDSLQHLLFTEPIHSIEPLHST